MVFMCGGVLKNGQGGGGDGVRYLGNREVGGGFLWGRIDVRMFFVCYIVFFWFFGEG